MRVPAVKSPLEVDLAPGLPACVDLYVALMLTVTNMEEGIRNPPGSGMMPSKA